MSAILETHGLGVAIGGVRILSDVSLSVRRGEIMAVLGPNGAGKTTLFNLLTGLRRPSAGRIVLNGTDITGAPVFRRARLGLVRSFQITSLFPSLTVLENARLAAQVHLGGSLALWRRVRPTDAAVAMARAALETVGIAEYADEPAGSLSHGAKRKLEVALAIVGKPAVLLLDEPTAGMSAEDVPELTEVIRRVRDRHGTTILLVEHRMDVAIGLADRMAVMHHGTLLACDTPDAVMADPLVQSAYLGEAL
ncbi:ABC transporter ATP-binding protein [Thermobispora bispora]|uniref:ABC transporter related protein n=1 Tax=Thermobispora bispora (strain ATCC 19993 / DSM 43833 / CBS 139.67 / JCM 10125 / KCTC 9307 / NBRC 14880 / R51) TaxID=469371 RepID=D6Y492_THEBD|nr:ABC transporter ATP-binding protein [Thermobispora bispora]ADG87146.1 ABC transporter related protein [Thermobispora bispora DSM 43833]